MARKTQVFTQLPWTGGLNTSVDSGVIGSNDLIIADNVVFSTSGARVKREGFDYLDTNIPTILGRQSSGTTRTLIFNAELNTASDDILVVGEKITVAGDVNYVGDFTIDSITTITPVSQNFLDADVNTSTENINITSHGFYTGLRINLSTSGTLPTGLINSTDYFIIQVDANNIKLAATEEDAINGIAIDITAASGGGTHTINPVVTTTNAITYTALASYSETLTSADSSETVSRNYKFLGVKDFWYLDSGVKTQRLIAVSDEPKFYSFDGNGNRKEISKDATATALTSPTKVNFLVANNTLLISFDKTANTPKKYAPATDANWFDLDGSPPNFEIAQLHLGRVFANDKTDPDRLHYSPPGEIEVWNGNGDSGAIDIFPGDGDQSGIIALAPPFKEKFYISKHRKIIDLQGDAPENFRPVPITEGLGMVSHNGIVSVDMDDLLFISTRGFHSMVATDTQGSFQANFVSKKIQSTFNLFALSNVDEFQGAYIPELNSVAFNTQESGENIKNHIYLFNIQEGEWYRWPDADAQALTSRIANESERRLVWGTSDGRIVQSQNGTYTDFARSGPIYQIKTGTIYPNNDAQSLKLFKKLSLYFKPKGDFAFTVKYRIDNQPENTLTFTQAQDADKLGTTFILGSSLLGIDAILAPYTKPLEGRGRGITLTIESTGTARPIEIYGYGIEFEFADINQEVV